MEIVPDLTKGGLSKNQVEYVQKKQHEYKLTDKKKKIKEDWANMKTIKISNLQEGDVFMYKGVIYEIVHKDKWETYCKYVNDKSHLRWFSSKYLYCKFSNYTKVEV